MIDFGSATFEDDHHSTIVSTRHYRAPEVIMGLGWNYPCDIWSIGCILVELFTGDALFQTHENGEHLAMMEVFFGNFPKAMIKNSEKEIRKMFDSKGRLRWPHIARSESSIRAVRNLTEIESLIPDKEFLHLILRMLEYEPTKRITAVDALLHPFFSPLLEGDDFYRKMLPRNTPIQHANHFRNRNYRHGSEDSD